MPPGVGAVIVRGAAVVPVVLIIMFTGVLCLLGLACGEKRREYVTTVSDRALSAIEVMLHGRPDSPPVRQRKPRQGLPGAGEGS